MMLSSTLLHCTSKSELIGANPLVHKASAGLTALHEPWTGRLLGAHGDVRRLSPGMLGLIRPYFGKSLFYCYWVFLLCELSCRDQDLTSLFFPTMCTWNSAFSFGTHLNLC